MPLQGTFDVLPFADVLELMAGRAATGRLHVRSRATGANLYLEKGRLVGADVGEAVTSAADDVRGRLSEVCFELLEADRGSFEFNPDLTGMGVPTMSLEVGEVLDTARSQREEWRDIQTVIKSPDLHPSLVPALVSDEVTVSREQWRVLSALDGRRSIRAVARLVEQSDYKVSRTLKALIEVGVVEIDAPARSQPGTTSGATIFLDDTVFADDTMVWAEGLDNGHDAKAVGDHDSAVAVDSNGLIAAQPSGSAQPSEPTQPSESAQPSQPVQPPEPAPPIKAAASTNGDSDSIWRGNVEDRGPILGEASPPSLHLPPTPRLAVPAAPNAMLPPSPTLAGPPVPSQPTTPATILPVRSPAPPESPDGPSKGRRMRIGWKGRQP